MRQASSKGHDNVISLQSGLACGIEAIPPYMNDKSWGLTLALWLSSLLNVILLFMILSLRHELHNCLHVLGVR